MKTKLKMFGVLRKFADDQGHYTLSLRQEMTVDQLKSVLKSELSAQFDGFDPRMIDESAVANRTDILTLGSKVVPSEELAILPPVCGG